VCGAAVWIEPSAGTGDAPCPRCGQLLWWLRDRIGDLPLDASLEEAGLDSLEVVELVMAIESEWGITIPDEDYEQLRSIGDVIRYLSRRSNDPPEDQGA
jgi:acyl carrier protein